VDLADFDRDAVLASFVVESEEGLDLMEQALVQMESNPSDPELLHSIFRVAHTIKGNATSLGLSDLAGFAHVVEDLLDVLREQQALPTADLISLLLKAVDELRGMVAGATGGGRELTSSQHALRKEIAREVEKRSSTVVDAGEASGNSGAAPKIEALPSASHRTLRTLLTSERVTPHRHPHRGHFEPGPGPCPRRRSRR